MMSTTTDSAIDKALSILEANLSQLISEHPEPAEESLRRRLEAIFRAQLDARIERLRARYADEERLAEYNEAHLSKSEREAARRTRPWELSERIAALERFLVETSPD